MRDSINLHTQRAIEIVHELKLEYQLIESQPLRKMSIYQVEALLNKANMLDSIFAFDLAADDRIADPLCSVLDPLIKALNQTYDELRARMNIAFSEAKTALKSDSIQI